MTKDELKTYLTSHYGDKLTFLDSGKYDLLCAVKVGEIKEVCRSLKNDQILKFDYLCNLGGIDTKQHLEVIYNLASLSNNLRLDLKVTMPYDQAEVDSVQEVWTGANWFEREMWELYGINIKGHDNLKRFLLPDDWNQGNPMRKDWDAPDFVRFPEFGA